MYHMLGNLSGYEFEVQEIKDGFEVKIAGAEYYVDWHWIITKQAHPKYDWQAFVSKVTECGDLVSGERVHVEYIDYYNPSNCPKNLPQ